jgi:group I intron endonuclease
MVGIYKITSPTGKVYIGQSWNIEKRWRSHKKGININFPLYNSIQKYGYLNHIFEIIHELPKDVSQDILDTYEILYINQYKDLGFKLLNIRDGGSRGKHSESTKNKIALAKKGSKNGMFGKKHSDETKLKFSKVHKGKKNSKEATQKQIDKVSKAIYQINPLTMEIIKEWKSATEAGRELNVNGTVISHGIKNKHKSYGYYWKFKN